jgi:intein/homing endonuclease
MTKIVYCQATWIEDFEDTKKCIERGSPHVDATVISYDQTLTEEQRAWLEENKERYKLVLVQYSFNDDMPGMRNSYLEKAKEIGADWCVVSDPDELFSEDLAKNLRKLIEEHNLLGYNLLPVHAVDQFENVEWLDNLDLLKETPGGYRSTDFWKPILIFKVYPDTHYEGVGVEGRVHETLKSSVPWKSKNLPREFSYIHKKSALRIWRNAARNCFISGGGDNVGALNRYWVKLRELCSNTLGIESWEMFEDFVKRGKAPEQFKAWMMEALQAPPTNYGTETRECAKFYYALHPDEITPEVRALLETPPKLTPEIEVENFVAQMYFEVLGRHPDEEGKRQYVEALLAGRITKEQLPQILMQSPEYLQKIGAPVGQVESVRMPVPVNVDVQISEGLFLEALRRSKTYWNTIKPQIDLGRFILGGLKKKDEFLRWFYNNKDKISLQELSEHLSASAPEPDSVALCIMGYSRVLPKIMESISVMGPYVDEIHIQGDDFTQDDILKVEEYIRSQKTLGWIRAPVNFHNAPWVDEFSDYKNKCIAPANTEWVLILDHDEIPTEEIAKNLREIIKKSDHGRRYNMVQFDVIDVDTVDGEVVSEHRSPSGKALLHWNVPEPYYGNPHIWLKPNYPWKTIHVPYAYRHVKERESILPNSVRNVFCLPGDQLVVTDQCVKEIQDVRIGEMVSGNSFDAVEEVFVRDYDGDLFEIKAMSMLPFKLTSEHPVLTAIMEWKIQNRRWTRRIKELAWKKAEDLSISHLRWYPNHLYSPEYLVFPKPTVTRNIDSIPLWPYYHKTGRRPKLQKPSCKEEVKHSNLNRWNKWLEEIPINQETAELFGYYLAEGSTSSGARLSFGPTEVLLAERAKTILEKYLPYKVTIIPRPDSLIVTFGGTVLSRFMKENFGHSALTKQIPPWILYNRREILQSFLDAYFRGDGNIHREGRTHLKHDCYTTSSKHLALQLQLAFARLGKFASIEMDKREGSYNFQGRLVHRNDRFIIRVVPRKNKRKYIEDVNAFYLPIRKITKTRYQGKVHNLKTNSNMYAVSNILVHNCGGGGDNTREQNPLWVELRALTKELNIDTWKEFHQYIKQGNIDKRILDVLKRMAKIPWKDAELADPLRYVLLLHPELEEKVK